jgi:hypothetical protein
MAYEKTPLMYDLPTPVNRPPAMAGLGISSFPKELVLVAGVVTAYLLYKRSRARSS